MEDETFKKIKKYMSEVSKNISDPRKIVSLIMKAIKSKRRPYMNIENMMDYIQKKTAKKSTSEYLINPVFPGSDVPLLNRHNIKRFIYEILKFGFSPTLLPELEIERRKLHLHYFKWEHKNEPKRVSVWTKKVITRGNFDEGVDDGERDSLIWSSRQITAFFRTKILNKILDLTGIKVDINLYKKQTEIKPYRKEMSEEISSWVKDMVFSEKCLSEFNIIKALEGSKIPEFSYGLDVESVLRCSFAQIAYTIKKENYVRKQKLQRVISKLVGNKKIRFKWQDICAKFSSMDRTLLNELAYHEEIRNYSMLTKRELCAEFAKKMESTMDEVKEKVPQCINTTSILGTDVDEIAPEFFYSYQHNGKIYCDDIRDLEKHFRINGPLHPIDRTRVDSNLVKNVKEWFRYLESIVLSMDDFDEEEIPLKSLLSSKVATFTSILNYPNSINLYTDASDDEIDIFQTELKKANIISNSEDKSINSIKSLDSIKIMLIDLLLMKIENDPSREIVNGTLISEFQMDISEIYNRVFR
jgi:hypothetical protein